MTILESPWFLLLLPMFSLGLFLLARARRVHSASLLAMAIAPLLLMGAGIWNRYVGERETLIFTAERFLPSAVELDQLPALPTEAKDPDVMMVMLGVGGAQPLLGFLHAHGSTGFRREEPQGRFAVMFREALDPALLQTLKPHLPIAQRLVASWGAETREEDAEPGKTLETVNGSFRVVGMFPDFEVRPDAQGRPVMGTRSQEPRDPWLEVEYLQPGRVPKRVLLSARQPELTQKLNAPNLPAGLKVDYRREGEELQTRFVVFTRGDHRVSVVENGVIVHSEGMAANRPVVVAPGLSVTALGFFDRFVPASTLANAVPALRLKVEDRERGRVERLWLRPNDTLPAPFYTAQVCAKMLPPDRTSKQIHLDVRVRDGRGAEWPPQLVHLAENGVGAALHLQRRPAAWLGWAALLVFLAGAGRWLVLWQQQRSGPDPGKPEPLTTDHPGS